MVASTIVTVIIIAIAIITMINMTSAAGGHEIVIITLTSKMNSFTWMVVAAWMA